MSTDLSTNQPSPNDLLLFAKVVEAGSFTRAAEAMGLPKSTLSRRIAALETLLGERLLLRTTRRLRLTDLGEAVLEHARQVVAETDAALALAQFRQQAPTGRLRVSMPADLAQLALAPALARFIEQHPRVTLALDLSPRRVDVVAENFDLAIRMGDLDDEAQLSARRVASFSGGLYATPQWLAQHGQPKHPDELCQPGCALTALVLGNRDGEPRPWQLQRLRADGHTEQWSGLPTRHTVANAPAFLIELACAGVGLTVVADFFAQAPLRSGRLVRLLPQWQTPPVPAWAVFPGRRLMPTRTRALLDALVDALAPCREPPASTLSSTPA